MNIKLFTEVGTYGISKAFPGIRNNLSSYRVTQYYNECTQASEHTPSGSLLRTPALFGEQAGQFTSLAVLAKISLNVT
jgi:hypothetical protein